MAILKPNKAKRPVSASNSLHYENETSKPNDENGQELENNMSVDTLIDPEDYESAGSLHFDNQETSHPVLASKKAKRVKANVDAEGNEGGSSLNPGTNNVGTIPNETDPDQGYIGASDDEELDEDDEDVFAAADDPNATYDPNNDPNSTVDPNNDPNVTFSPSSDPNATFKVKGADVDLQNNMGVDTLTANDMDPDWDPPPPDEDGDDEDDDEEDVEPSADIEVEDVEDEPPAPEETAGAEDLSILDIDKTPDSAVDDVMFAAAGTRLLVLKANRVIASMTGRMAIASGRNDVYLTDQFQEVTAMQIKASGLRRGLKQMGFVLAKVDLAGQHVLAAQVKKEVYKTTAAVRKVEQVKAAAFQQALAIASVGINRRMFKGVHNELRASLEGELRRYGIRNADKILASAFAEHGPAYAKQVIELANKISAMPEEVRDSYVDALDLQEADFDQGDDTADMVGIGAEEEGLGQEGDDIDVGGFGETIEASLARPGHKLQASAAANGKYSVNANQILNGSRSLF